MSPHILNEGHKVELQAIIHKRPLSPPFHACQGAMRFHRRPQKSRTDEDCINGAFIDTNVS